MYLVSSRLFNIAGSKQVALLIVLQMSVLLASAQSSSAQASGLAAGQTAVSANSAAPVAQTFQFPAWPQRSQFQKEVIPPPPPGPYMSTALSDNSVKPRSFGMDFQQYEGPRQGNHNIFATPMDMFSPDIAWPDLRPGKKGGYQRWVPENGYQYREPAAAVNRVQNKPSYYNSGQYKQKQYSQGRYNQSYGHAYQHRNANMPSRVPSMSMGSNGR